MGQKPSVPEQPAVNPEATDDPKAAAGEGGGGLSPERRRILRKRFEAVLAFKGNFGAHGDVAPLSLVDRKDVEGTRSHKSLGFATANAYSLGSGVIKDPPRNVFGPGYVLSPDVYPDLFRTGPPDRYILTFQQLSPEERLSWFETFVHFSGKMGLLLRSCDMFSAAIDVYDLFLQVREAVRQTLLLPHARLWYVDRKKNHCVCVFNNSGGDTQNGRTVPILGSFPGEVMRNKKTVLCNKAATDSRFGSWQLKEMQEMMGEAIAVVAGVSLLDSNGEVVYVLEAYGPDENRVLDGSDAFLLQILADYSGPAISAISRRWHHSQVSLLPTLLLENDTFVSFIEDLRRHLKEIFSAADAEIFVAESSVGGAMLWRLMRTETLVEGKPKLRAAESKSGLLASSGRQFLSMKQKGIACRVAQQTCETEASAMHVCESADKDKDYNEHVDGKCISALTFSVTSEEMYGGTGLLAVVQLRDRIWQAEQTHTLDRTVLKRTAGFGTQDVELVEQLQPHLSRSLVAALNVEDSRKSKYEANHASQQAHSIMGITDCIARGTDINTLFPMVVQEVMKLLKCDRATMFLLADDGKTLWSMVRPFPVRPGSQLMHIEVPVTENSIAGSCVLDRATINLDDAYNDTRFNKKTDRTTGYRTRSLLAVPILDSRTQNIRGCMQCLNKLNNFEESEEQVFTDEDVSLAVTFASFVAVALERAHFNATAGSAVNMAVRSHTKTDTESNSASPRGTSSRNLPAQATK